MSAISDKGEDVLSLHSSDEERDFSGFEPEDIDITKKSRKSLKSVVSVPKAKPRKQKEKIAPKKQKSNNKECLVQIDLNNEDTVKLLRDKLGLIPPHSDDNTNRPVLPLYPTFDNYEIDYGEYDHGESLDLNTAPNIHVEFTNDSDLDSIGAPIQSNVRNKSSNANKKLAECLARELGSEEKENVTEWKIPKLKEKIKSPAITQSLADLVNMACTTNCDTDEIEEKYRVPENCDKMSPPMVNEEIWKIMDKRTRSYDRLFYDIQNNLAAGMIPLLKITDIMKSQLKENEEARSLFSDALTMFGQVQYKLSIRRRYLIRPNINKKYKNICNVSVPVSTKLFGDDISKEIKNCDAGINLGNYQRPQYVQNVPQCVQNAPRGRYMPYQHQRGNYGGPYRGQPIQRRPFSRNNIASGDPNGEK